MMSSEPHLEPATLTDEAVTAIGEGLLAGTWPAAEWRHAHHVIATAWLILERPDIALDAELPGIIRGYNLAQGGQNTATSGYHHTITVFYLAEIRRALRALPGGLSLAETCRRLLASPLGDKALPLTVYPRELLFSPEARLGYVAPPVPAPEEVRA